MTNAPQNSAGNGQGDVPTSPLIKLLQSLGMGKKPKGPVPAENAAPAAAPASPQGKGGEAGMTAAQMTSGVPQMPAGALVTVLTRNQFYRDGFRNLMKVAIIQGIVIIGLFITLLLFINASQPQDRYFATTADGRIMPVMPLDVPNKQVAGVISWSVQAASQVMTFGFHDYQQKLQDSAKYFTRHGWETFTVALEKSKILDNVNTLNQVVKAQPSGAPVLTQQGVFNGRYRWIIQMPLQVTFKWGTMSRVDRWDLILVIVRVPSLENAEGIGIEQWIVAPS